MRRGRAVSGPLEAHTPVLLLEQLGAFQNRDQKGRAARRKDQGSNPIPSGKNHYGTPDLWSFRRSPTALSPQRMIRVRSLALARRACSWRGLAYAGRR